MMLERLLSSSRFHARLPPLVSLTVDMRDVYASSHWAVEGRPPAYHTPDEDVYLPGRNVILLAKAAVYCATAHLNRLVLGTLAHNPFPGQPPRYVRAVMYDYHFTDPTTARLTGAWWRRRRLYVIFTVEQPPGVTGIQIVPSGR